MVISEIYNSWKKFSLSDFLDGYIPVEFQENAEMHRRARMFMLSHVFGPVIGSSLPVYLYVMDIARDYRTETREVTRDDAIALRMAPGGGWAAVLEPVK